jgi:hypothetical protein
MTNQETISSQSFYMNRFTVTGVLPNGKEFTTTAFARDVEEAKRIILLIEPCAIVRVIR